MTIDIRKTTDYEEWFAGLRDGMAKARINARITRLADGNPGDVGPVGEGVSEMRLHFGPGYRVYYIGNGDQLIVLLAGGTKNNQQSDIGKAIELARNL
jgi:putative addiction module killer protein